MKLLKGQHENIIKGNFAFLQSSLEYFKSFGLQIGYYRETKMIRMVDTRFIQARAKVSGFVTNQEHFDTGFFKCWC